MKLGMICGWSAEDFEYVKRKGLECVEFCVNHNYDADAFLAEAPQIRARSEATGIAVGSIGRWGMDRLDENGEILPAALHADQALIDAASIIGCPVFNFGVNAAEKLSFEENCAAAIRYAQALLDYAEGKGVKLATYNCDWSNFVYNDAAWSVVHKALPALGIKYDASHCIGRKGDYLKELRDWGDRVYHVHVKGVLVIDGEPYDDAPAGLDSINWGGLLDVLYTKDYDGMLSIEPHSHFWGGVRGQWGVDFTIGFIRPFLMPADYDESKPIFMP
ncbi:MAG: sugar phosphate isomerase/epimerase [Clostridia bacterium]|nr:sugar phosphate isomerase/epimerase [Clostridia bacterium]